MGVIGSGELLQAGYGPLPDTRGCRITKSASSASFSNSAARVFAGEHFAPAPHVSVNVLEQDAHANCDQDQASEHFNPLPPKRADTLADQHSDNSERGCD